MLPRSKSAFLVSHLPRLSWISANSLFVSSRIFQEIIDTVGDMAGEPVGLLTADDRDSWTKAREHLVSLADSNREILETIEASTLVVPLEDSNPTGIEKRAWDLWVRDGENRWFDKHERESFILLPP